MRARFAVPGLLALLLLSAFGAAADEPPNFERLPLAPPGKLGGRIVYFIEGGCARRIYDLASGTDQPFADDVCERSPPVPGHSPDGKIVATWTGFLNYQLVLVHPDGRRVPIGRPLPRAAIPASYNRLVSFSSDSRRVAACHVARGRLLTLVADTASGEIIERQFGTCEFALTARGVATIRGGKVMLRGQVLLAASRSEREMRLGLPLDLAANPAGTRLAVTTRDDAPGRSADRVTVLVLDLRGRILGRYEKQVTIRFDPIQLGPQGRSMVVTWGDIYQLVRLDPARHTFTILFGVPGPAVTRPTFSPDGRFAAMGQPAFRPLGPHPPKPNMNTVILDANTFKALYRVPIAGPVVTVWLP